MMMQSVKRRVLAAIAGASFAGAASAAGPTPEQFFEWATWYTTGDMRADFDGDGDLDSEDFGAFLRFYTTNGGGAGPNNPGGGPDDEPDDDTKDDEPDTTNGDDDVISGGGGSTGGGSGGGGGGSGGSGPDGPTTGGDGWTQFTASPDTIKIYVSASGNDRFNGRTPETAVRTIDRGKDLIRDGKPDWLLLRAGDTFRETLGDWKKSGRSTSEPMLVSAYGDGPRPRLITGTDRGMTMIGYRDFRKHIAFVGLHIEPSTPGSAEGISFVTGAIEDILIEDCYIANFDQNLVVQGQKTDQIENVRLRRNVIVDASGSTHSQGLFAAWLDGLLLEENIFDRNGWDFRQGRNATATIFAHNVYIQKTAQNVIARGNISMRASSHGMQARTGGVIEGNFFARNPIGLLFANDESKKTNLSDEVVRDNLVVEGVHLNTRNPRSWGIHVQDINRVAVLSNIVVNSLESDRGWGISVSGPDGMLVTETVIENNIVDDYGDTLRIRNENAVDVLVRNNIFTRSSGDKSLVDHSDNGRLPAVRYQGNKYQHLGSGQPFVTGARRYTLNQWRNIFDPGAQTLQQRYVDGDRSLDDYARSIGLANANALFDAMRRQSRGSYDERLTAEAIREYYKQGFTLR